MQRSKADSKKTVSALQGEVSSLAISATGIPALRNYVPSFRVLLQSLKYLNPYREIEATFDLTSVEATIASLYTITSHVADIIVEEKSKAKQTEQEEPVVPRPSAAPQQLHHISIITSEKKNNLELTLRHRINKLRDKIKDFLLHSEIEVDIRDITPVNYDEKQNAEWQQQHLDRLNPPLKEAFDNYLRLTGFLAWLNYTVLENTPNLIDKLNSEQDRAFAPLFETFQPLNLQDLSDQQREKYLVHLHKVLPSAIKYLKEGIKPNRQQQEDLNAFMHLFEHDSVDHFADLKKEVAPKENTSANDFMKLVALSSSMRQKFKDYFIPGKYDLGMLKEITSCSNTLPDCQKIWAENPILSTRIFCYFEFVTLEERLRVLADLKLGDRNKQNTILRFMETFPEILANHNEQGDTTADFKNTDERINQYFEFLSTVPAEFIAGGFNDLINQIKLLNSMLRDLITIREEYPAYNPSASANGFSSSRAIAAEPEVAAAAKLSAAP